MELNFSEFLQPLMHSQTGFETGTSKLIDFTSQSLLHVKSRGWQRQMTVGESETLIDPVMDSTLFLQFTSISGVASSSLNVTKPYICSIFI